MEYSNAPDSVSWKTCDKDFTKVTPGVWYVRTKGSELVQASDPVQIIVQDSIEGFYVLINVPDNSNMTRDLSYGETFQSGLTEDNPMKEVVFKANSGYCFPENYPVCSATHDLVYSMNFLHAREQVLMDRVPTRMVRRWGSSKGMQRSA